MRKKLQSITGKRNGHLKPEKSRKLINKFHALLKAKRMVLKDAKLESFLSSAEMKQYKEYKHKYVADKTQTPEKEILQRAAALKGTERQSIVVLLAQIEALIETQGGLETYQAASLSGQNSKRGSDSSKKLVEWLQEMEKAGDFEFTEPMRALEVGCLSSKNKISNCKYFKNKIVRIDLNSQEPDKIASQDFMKMPVASFDVVSLSLVLNFVPSTEDRGEMLKRVGKFLQISKNEKTIFPCLFFVLPLPCITNSKYVDKKHLLQIFHELGYQLLKYHESQKLVYMLLKYHGTEKRPKFKKKELDVKNKSSRNNFAIVLS